MIGRLNDAVTLWLQASGLSGIKLDLAASAMLAFLVMFTAIVIGLLIEKLNVWIVDFTAKTTGKGIALFILNRVMFVGTVFHELSHALFAVMSGAKVKKIRCFTLFSKDLLGYVEFIPRGGYVKKAVQLSLVSCAPVLTAFVTVPTFALLSVTGQVSFGMRVFLMYCAVSIFCHASMSMMDLKLYAKGAVFTLPLFTVLLFLARFFMMKV